MCVLSLPRLLLPLRSAQTKWPISLGNIEPHPDNSQRKPVAMSAIVYIVNAILQYLLVTAFLLRVLLPLARANMRNPLSQAVLRATNPLVLPLRKMLPPIGRLD